MKKMSKVFKLPLFAKMVDEEITDGIAAGDIVTLPVILNRLEGREPFDSWDGTKDKAEAICRAVNEYDEARELLGEWQEWWDASQNYTNPEEMNMPPDPRKRTCKFLGDES